MLDFAIFLGCGTVKDIVLKAQTDLGHVFGFEKLPLQIYKRIKYALSSWRSARVLHDSGESADELAFWTLWTEDMGDVVE